MSAEIVRINKEQPEASLVTYVAEQLKAGQVLGMPTDTFYGLAADPFNLRAVKKIYDVKSRQRNKPLSLLPWGYWRLARAALRYRNWQSPSAAAATPPAR